MVGSLIAIGIVPQAMQRPDSTHLAWVTCISWPLAVVAVVEIVRLRRPTSHPRRRLTDRRVARRRADAGRGAAVHLSLLRERGAGVGRRPPGRVPGRARRAALLPRRRPAVAGEPRRDRRPRRAVAAPASGCSSAPRTCGARGTATSFFYWMFPELEPATYFIEMDPGLANEEGSSLADDVASADWVILTGFWNGWREPNTSMDFGSDAPEPGDRRRSSARSGRSRTT